MQTTEQKVFEMIGRQAFEIFKLREELAQYSASRSAQVPKESKKG
jgi:hypothetical protein